MSEPLLEVEALALRFGGVSALSDVSLQLFDGEPVGLIGPNGAGKTSLFNCITGFYRATEGRVHFRGHDLTHLRADVIANLGIRRTFQNLRLFPRLSVLENVLTGAHQRADSNLLRVLVGTPGYRSAEERLVDEADALLEFVGVGQYREAPASDLPYGMQKRLELARALIGEPSLLLLDEPAAGLNTFERREYVQLIRQINGRGIGVLMIEHDMDMVMTFARRLIVLDYGKKIAEGTPDEVRHNPAVVTAYLGGETDERS